MEETTRSMWWIPIRSNAASTPEPRVLFTMRGGAPLPLPPRHEPRARGRGALHRQARLRPDRAPRSHRRRPDLLRGGALVDGARRARFQAAAVGARARGGERRRPARAVAAA